MIRWLDHTADVSFEIICDRYEELFQEFVRGLRSLMVSGDVRPRTEIAVVLAESGPADLLVALGRRVLYLFETERFIPTHLEVRDAGPTRLAGGLWGEPFDPSRMEYHLEVKGVTYHNLAVEEEKGKWMARVTFDV